ncbi:MAG TPA: asparagine synthase (glutamine-hydrolyzing) [Anaeromyxobacteraceae bacterium]|nr:asparagine synthase (glutamine-hydrolyzing) [Anaeromyxobacteraceae bacterium]
MCGIAGEVRFKGPPDGEAARRMATALAHRGPDASGFYLDPRAALAHRRLSILDLEGGAQPMEREGCVLSFNGEAYRHEELRRALAARGHPFTTRSDTEVVLRAYLEWGEGFVERIDGMFALALYDSREEKLLLARDRMGKKPLYYALARGESWLKSPPRLAEEGVHGLVFASELKAFAAHGGVPRELDPEALVRYLAVEYVPAPHSIHQSIFKLPAAHLAVLDRRSFRMRRYWELPVPAARRDSPTLAAAEGELLTRLEGAVARRLVADVPVGVFLSGGIDSTAIAALAARHKQPLETFAIGFEEDSFDESRWARMAADHIGSRHHEKRLSGRESQELLPEVVELLDEPLADASILPSLLLSKFVRRHVTVALSGDGGDELLAGYDTFLAHAPALLAARAPREARKALAALLARLPASQANMSLEFRLKQFLRGLEFSPSLRQQAWIGSLVPDEVRSVVAPGIKALATPEVAFAEVLEEARASAVAGLSPGSVDEALRFFLTRYLADDILVKADRASMAASLEVRAPFLDTEVVEYVVKLPSRYKLGTFATKRLLRMALRGLVPEAILRRPKKGFGIPVAAWIRGPWRPLFEELFSRASLVRSGVLDPEAARALLDRHLGGREDLRKPLFTLACFLLWQRRWGGEGLGRAQGEARVPFPVSGGNSASPAASR